MSIQNIFQTEKFNNLFNDEFINKFKNHKDFNILKHLKEIQTYILNNFKLNLRMGMQKVMNINGMKEKKEEIDLMIPQLDP